MLQRLPEKEAKRTHPAEISMCPGPGVCIPAGVLSMLAGALRLVSPGVAK